MDRIISDEWLDDEYICEMDDQTYRIYDLLIKSTNRIGITRISKSLVCWRANRMDGKAYDEIVARLSADRKILIHNGYTIILNHYKHWDYSKPTGAKGAIQDLIAIIDDLTDSPQVIEYVGKLVNKCLTQQIGKSIYDDIYITVVQHLFNKCSIPVKQTKEKEKEKEKEKQEIEKEREREETDDPEKIVSVNGVLMRNKEVDKLIAKLGGDDEAYQRITKRVFEYYDKRGGPQDGYQACLRFIENEKKWKEEERDGKPRNRKKST